MISTRRMVAAVGLAAGLAGLAAPLASAAEPAADSGKINPMAMLDSLTTKEIPAQHQANLPKPSQQLKELNGLNNLQEVGQVLAPAAPVLGLLGA
ncbi:hypothetical protein ACIQOU_11855 [Streptomyces sp. NPDC091279]|uniref:hypothetical protein n=1 Tax=unclassified Streptomyces TaxID=2593676 RepID=UPI00381F9A09